MWTSAPFTDAALARFARSGDAAALEWIAHIPVAARIFVERSDTAFRFPSRVPISFARRAQGRNGLLAQGVPQPGHLDVVEAIVRCEGGGDEQEKSREGQEDDDG